jgi:hypothetical protein
MSLRPQCINNASVPLASALLSVSELLSALAARVLTVKLFQQRGCQSALCSTLFSSKADEETKDWQPGKARRFFILTCLINGLHAVL